MLVELLLNKDKISELGNSGIFIFNKISELRKINDKLAMTSQIDLTRFYDVIMRNSVFQLGFSTRFSNLGIPDSSNRHPKKTV